MLRIKPYNLLVCLVFLAMTLAANTPAYSTIYASAADPPDEIKAPATPAVSGGSDVKEKKIAKVRPIQKVRPPSRADEVLGATLSGCILPVTRVRGWELGAEALFARAKGKVRFARGTYGFVGTAFDDVDLNADMGLPDHQTVGSFSVRYRFRPNWSIRYAIMPMEINGSGNTGRSFTFGNTMYNAGSNSRVKWERLYHRVGLVYDPIRTNRAKVSLFADYVRLDEKLSLSQTGAGFGGDTFDHSLNMGMAGLEFERCLRTGKYCNTLSMECKAGVAFLDEAFGSDVATGLKYSIHMGSGRWGYLAGGYRFVTFKKGYSDAVRIDTALEGGYLKMGFVF